MNEIVTVISTVGFPIVACMAMGWFCVKVLDKMDETVDKMTVQISLNTKAVESLVQHLDRKEE